MSIQSIDLFGTLGQIRISVSSVLFVIFQIIYIGSSHIRPINPEVLHINIEELIIILVRFSDISTGPNKLIQKSGNSALVLGYSTIKDFAIPPNLKIQVYITTEDPMVLFALSNSIFTSNLLSIIPLSDLESEIVTVTNVGHYYLMIVLAKP